MKKRASRHKEKKLIQMVAAAKSIDGICDLIAFLFIFRPKMTLFIIILIIAVVTQYPEIIKLLV